MKAFDFDFMFAAERRAALQWARQYFREPTPTTRGSYFVDRRISLFRPRAIIGESDSDAIISLRTVLPMQRKFVANYFSQNIYV